MGQVCWNDAHSAILGLWRKVMQWARVRQLLVGLTFIGGMVSNADTVEVSSSTAMSQAISGAADFQVLHSHTWKDYETVMVLATLNGAAKMAANTGKTMTAADYVALGNQVQNWLDQKAPQSQTLANKSHADILRLASDTLFSIVNEAPVAGPPLATYLGGLEKSKIDKLETTLDPSRQAAANVDFLNLQVQAKQFGSDRAQESYLLALNDPQFAIAVDPLLHDFIGLKSKRSYDDATALYPSVPSQPKNSDGGFNVDPTDLVNQHNSIVSSVRFDPAQSSITGISKLISLADPRSAQLVATVGGSALQVGEGVSKNLQTTENMTSAAQGLAAVALTGSIAQDASFCSSNISSNGHLSANRHPHLEVLWSRGLWQGNESPLMLGYLDAMRQQ
jgi:hypothetical protein